MKYAQKIALDLDREYRRVRRPAVPVKKGALSLDIKRILKQKKKDDQEKVKDYVNALHRYINIRDTIPQEQTELQINPLNEPRTPPPPPPQPINVQTKKKRKKRRRVIATREWAQYP